MQVSGVKQQKEKKLMLQRGKQKILQLRLDRTESLFHICGG